MVSKAEVVKPQAFPAGYTLVGDRYTVLDKLLNPGDSIMAERGTMMYTSPGVVMRTRFNGYGAFAGEAIAKVEFTNKGEEAAHVGLATNMPMAIVIPVEMDRHGGLLNCKRGAYMAGDPSVRVLPKILPTASCLACCCSGMPPVIQSLRGTGFAVLNAGGTVLKKELAADEEIIVDSGSVVAFSGSVDYDVRASGNLLACCCGGEGFFNTKLTGPGTVYLQTLSYEGLARMLVTVRQQGDDAKGKGTSGEED